MGEVNKYIKGAVYEWKVKKEYENKNYLVIRSAGSHSPIDLVAINEKEIIFIQCKRIKKISSIEKKEIEDFKKIKIPFNCRKEFHIKRDYENEIIIPC
jgi:Holliday junction resolvase